MMTTPAMRALGALAGVFLALAIVGAVGGRSTTHAPPGPIISECDGALAEIVIQYARGSDAALPVFRDFLRQLDADVIVNVMCPDDAAYAELIAAVGEVSCSLRRVIVDHEITAWSRDRWVALGTRGRSSRVELLAPFGEAGADLWPARKGDERLIFDLANLSDGTISARRGALYFDAGDFLADESRVFVTPAVVRSNLLRTVKSTEALKGLLERSLGKPIVLLQNAPDHHAGMFMMAAGDNVMLVGDPSLARAITSNQTLPNLAGGPDWSAKTQDKFDAVARQVASLGYRVVRIPTVVAADDPKCYLTYVNVIMDRRGDRRIVYLPTYHGADAMNLAAEQVWHDLGYEVRPVDCTSTYPLYGNLHCLVNVLHRA